MDQLYKQLLSEFLSFRSISTDPQFAPEITKTVAWLKETFEAQGFAVNVVEGYDNPLVVATYTIDPSYKTVLVYGHYDVQPASGDEGWHSDPFMLSERSGRIYGRGVIDNKGQHLVHAVNIFEHIQNRTLGYNIVFFIEGGEEIGSPHLEQFMHDHKDLVRSDFVLLSDGEMLSDTPVIESGFRGVFNGLLTVQVGTADLHSGTYGGIAPNAIHELAKIIAGLYRADNTLFDRSLYQGVSGIDPGVLADNARIPFSEEEYGRMTGRKTVFVQPGMDVYTCSGLMPSIEITGIAGGYAGDGYRNAIPYRASAKVNVRLAPSQEPKRIYENLEKAIRAVAPPYVDVTLSYDQSGKGTLLDPANEYVRKASSIFEQVWGKKPVFKYVGGSLPIVTLFNEELHTPLVMAPLVNEDCNMHGANENFDCSYLDKAMAFSKRFFART